MFGFGTYQETKENHDKAKKYLADLNIDLKNEKSRIRELQISTGKAWSNAVKFGIGALTAAGITAIAYGVDQYKFGGKYTEMAKGYKEAGVKMGTEAYEQLPDVPYLGAKARALREANQ